MINFKSVTSKNFLSIGDNPVTVRLDYGVPTLVTGKNGNGKSGSVIEPLVFGLFGKSFRGVNKAGLINSINKKNCCVEVDFTVGQDVFKVVRGMKPNIFDIYVNGEKLHNEAAIRDQQKYLESQILKTTYKSFSQVVILGSAAYVPFMQLKASERREVIETLLDIGVFSDMNKLLKEEIAEWKQTIEIKKAELDGYKREISLLRGFIEKLESSSSDKKDKQLEALNKVKANLSTIIRQIKEKQEEIRAHDANGYSFSDIENDKATLQGLKDKLATTLHTNKTAIAERKFFETTTECTVCDQPITEQHRNKHIKQLSDECLRTEKEAERLIHEDIPRYESIIIDHNDYVEDGRRLQSELDSLHTYKDNLFESGKKLRESLVDETTTSTESINEEKAKLKDLQNKKRLVESELRALAAKNDSYKMATTLLKDDGIKSAIIKQYLPVLNAQVNKYLQLLSFNIKFELSDTFKETIKSRFRDEFTYESFSMGERQRLDLALLFGWRDVARMKNSVNCNLIIMDEIFDSSLDKTGLEDLLQILHEQTDNLSTMIISHRDGIEDKFSQHIEFVKQNGFTRIATS